jgi:5-methylcytosine-specific restriction endonuclease McrA
VNIDEELWALRSLRAEGVPMKELYPMYLRTKWWQSLRQAALERDNNQCVLCGSQMSLHVDHKWYPGFGEEGLVDVQTLCRVCHQRKTRFVLSDEKDVVKLDTRSLYKTLRRG